MESVNKDWQFEESWEAFFDISQIWAWNLANNGTLDYLVSKQYEMEQEPLWKVDGICIDFPKRHNEEWP